MRGMKEPRKGFLIFFALFVFVISVQASDVGPSNGYLVIVGGAMRDPAIFARFIELAGGPDAPIVIRTLQSLSFPQQPRERTMINTGVD